MTIVSWMSLCSSIAPETGRMGARMTTFADLEQKVDAMKQAVERLLQATKELKEIVSKSWVN